MGSTGAVQQGEGDQVIIGAHSSAGYALPLMLRRALRLLLLATLAALGWLLLGATTSSASEGVGTLPAASETVTTAAQSATPAIEKVPQLAAPAMEKAAKPVAPVVAKAVEPVAPVVEKAVEPVAPVVEKAVEPVAPVVEKAVEPVAPVVEKVARKVAEPVVPLVKKVTKPVASAAGVVAPTRLSEKARGGVPEPASIPVFDGRRVSAVAALAAAAAQLQVLPEPAASLSAAQGDVVAAAHDSADRPIAPLRVPDRPVLAAATALAGAAGHGGMDGALTGTLLGFALILFTARRFGLPALSALPARPGVRPG